MDGALYTATEIIVFLLVATAIGVVLGRLWAMARRPAAGTSAEETRQRGADADAALRAELTEARRGAEAAEAEAAELRKQLSVVEWQVSTLEEELANRPPAGG